MPSPLKHLCLAVITGNSHTIKLPESCEFALILQKQLNKNLREEKKMSNVSFEKTKLQKSPHSVLSATVPVTVRSPATALYFSAYPVRSEAPAVGSWPQHDLLWPCARPSPDIRMMFADVTKMSTCLFLSSMSVFLSLYLYDFPDFTLWLQFVQLHESHPDRLVAPQEASENKTFSVTLLCSSSQRQMWHF